MELYVQSCIPLGTVKPLPSPLDGMWLISSGEIPHAKAKWGETPDVFAFERQGSRAEKVGEVTGTNLNSCIGIVTYFNSKKVNEVMIQQHKYTCVMYIVAELNFSMPLERSLKLELCWYNYSVSTKAFLSVSVTNMMAPFTLQKDKTSAHRCEVDLLLCCFIVWQCILWICWYDILLENARNTSEIKGSIIWQYFSCGKSVYCLWVHRTVSVNANWGANRTPGKENKACGHSVGQYQLNINVSRDNFQGQNTFFSNLYTCTRSLCFHLFWNWKKTE